MDVKVYSFKAQIFTNVGIPGLPETRAVWKANSYFTFSLFFWLYFYVLKPRSTPVVLENAVKRIYFNFNRLSISMRVFLGERVL